MSEAETEKRRVALLHSLSCSSWTFAREEGERAAETGSAGNWHYFDFFRVCNSDPSAFPNLAHEAEAESSALEAKDMARKLRAAASLWDRVVEDKRREASAWSRLARMMKEKIPGWSGGRND